jgi:hypothetical protein
MDAAGHRSEPATGAACSICGRPTYDPGKRERPWARGVAQGRQVLVCPECQTTTPGWADSFDRCEACGSPRLSVMLGEVACRACGRIQDAPEELDPAVDRLIRP